MSFVNLTRRSIYLLVLCLIAKNQLASATMVIPLDRDQMTRQAGRIFRGRCLDISSELDEHQIPSTYVRFQVIEGMKGVQGGETILIKQFGSHRTGLNVREGEKALVPLKTMQISPSFYSVGEEYLLYLYPESRLGFTSPVGGGQGRFEIK